MLNELHVLITAYVAGNLGDDLFISILCQRYPKTKFFLFCPIEYISFYNNISNLKLIDEQKIDKLKFIDEINIQVMIGGSLFMQPKDKNMIYPKFQIVKSCRLSTKIPFLIIGANFGPYSEKLHLNFISHGSQK